MFRKAGIWVAVLALLLAAGIAAVSWPPTGATARPLAVMSPEPAAAPAPPPVRAPLPAPVPPAVEDVLQSGVLIVISKASQRMYVFKDGAEWGTSPVSTGRRGHSTPAGVFPILQKKTFHRSNIYSNAPMPFMQRLTWGGIAIHSGHLPGYPASHGCVRLPRAFAAALFKLTRAETTTVVIANEPVTSASYAQQFALGLNNPETQMAALPAAQPPRMQFQPFGDLQAQGGQTIQLAAATSPAEAEAHWAQLLNARPELGGFRKAIVPAVVGSRQYYRLRVSAPGAYAYCASLKRAGIPCFNVS